MSREAHIFPYDTDKLIDLIMAFVDLYNSASVPRIKLYPYQRVFQRRVIESLLLGDCSTITALYSRQSGKSEAVACLVNGLCIFVPALAREFPDDPRLSKFAGGVYIGCYAPILKQSKLIFERIRDRAIKNESKEIYSDASLQLTVNESNGERVKWSNGSFVIAQTASENSSGEGFTFHLIIIDEAQQVSGEKVAKELQPMLTKTAGTMVFIGTASISHGCFRNSIITNIEEEKKGGPRDHFEFPYDQVVAQHLAAYDEELAAYNAGEGPPPNENHKNYKKASEKELATKYNNNKDHPIFAMNYCLKWQDANLGAVDRDAFKEAADPEREANQPSYRNRQVAGIDWGRSNDSTVLTIMEVDDIPISTHALLRNDEEAPEYKNKHIIAWLELQGKWKDQLDIIVDFLEDYRVDTIMSDATGTGSSVTEFLQDRLPGIEVIPFVFTQKGNDEIYTYYLNELESGRITYPAGPETMQTPEYISFIFQHTVLVKTLKGKLMSCHAPEGEHDDYSDSAALACLASTHEPVMEVEVVQNPMYAQSSFNRCSTRADRYR